MKYLKRLILNESRIDQTPTYNKFINDFIDSVGNPIIMSMLFRMMDTDEYKKFGVEVYKFTDLEKERLNEVKPLLDDLVKIVAEIKNKYK